MKKTKLKHPVAIIIAEGYSDYICCTTSAAHDMAKQKAKENPGNHYLIFHSVCGYIEDEANN
jgi:hypothetical protein